MFSQSAMKCKYFFSIIFIFFICFLVAAGCGRDLELDPQDVTITLPSRLYVVNSDSASLSIINTETNTVESSISLAGPLGETPWEIALSPDGKKAYVTLPNVWMVVEVDIINNIGRNYFDAKGGAAGIVVSPDGKFAYTANYHSSSVSKIDLETESTSTLEVDHPISLAINTDGTRLFVLNLDQHMLSVISAESMAKIGTVLCGISPYGIDFSSANNRVYVANFGSANLSIVNPSTNAVEAFVMMPSGAYPNDVAVSPNGKFTFVANFGRDDVSVVDLTTRSVIKSIPVGQDPFAIVSSTDGKKVYVTNLSSDTVSVIDTGTLSVEATIAVGDAPRGLAYGGSGL